MADNEEKCGQVLGYDVYRKRSGEMWQFSLTADGQTFVSNVVRRDGETEPSDDVQAGASADLADQVQKSQQA